VIASTNTARKCLGMEDAKPRSCAEKMFEGNAMTTPTLRSTKGYGFQVSLHSTFATIYFCEDVLRQPRRFLFFSGSGMFSRFTITDDRKQTT